MTKDDIKELVRQTIAKRLDVPILAVTDVATLVGDLGGDSLSSIELVADVEDQFDIEVVDDEIPHLQTVCDVASLVAEKLGVFA